MLITVAAILLSFSKAEGMQSGFVAGIILTVLAVLVTMYALAVYYRRIHLLEKGLPYGYIDHMGPAVLAVAVAAGIAAAIYVAAYNHKSLEMSTAALVAEPGCCVEHGFKGISLLEYQPSDVVVDELKNLLIIPSQSKITSIPLEINDTPPDVKVLVEVPGVDMESVALVNGRLFALSEDKDMSILLAFDLKTNIFNKAEEFQLVGR